jgi:hypothetical protein
VFSVKRSHDGSCSLAFLIKKIEFLVFATSGNIFHNDAEFLT